MAFPPCNQFEQRYVGDGLSVSLPSSATMTTASGTADQGPVHAATGAQFAIDGVLATVGRRVGTEVVPEPSVDQRVDDGVVIYVKAEDPSLRACLLDSASYDAARDEQD